MAFYNANLADDYTYDIRKLYAMGDCYDKTPVYENGVNSISYTSSKEETIYFNYLLNDGEDAEIKINGATVLTVYSGEQLTDISFKLAANDIISVTGSSIRAKYFTY